LGDSVDGGVEVIALVPGGPCQQAGVRVGDILLEANEVDLAEQGKLRGVLTATLPGDPVRLILLRQGRPVETLVTAGRRPATSVTVRRGSGIAVPTAMAPRFPGAGLESGLPGDVLGLRLTGVTPQLRRHYGAPADAGVLVTALDPDKLAAAAGVEVGDVLVTLDGRKIVRTEQFESTLLTWKWNRPLRAGMVRDRERREVVLVSAARTPDGAGDARLRDDLDAARRARQIGRRELDASRLELEIRQLERRLEALRSRLELLRREP